LVVEGGKAHQLVAELAGVVAGEPGESVDGVFADPGEACGLADAAAVGEVGQYRPELIGGQAGVEERGALALGEAGLASLAVEQAAARPGAGAHTDGEVGVVTATVVGAIGVQAAKATEVIQGRKS
jgi:hypothetical protein